MTTSAREGREGEGRDGEGRDAEEGSRADVAAYEPSSAMPSDQRGWITGRAGSEVLLGVLEDRPQPALDVVELRLPDDERRRELDDRVATVVGAAVDAGVEQGLGQVAAQQPLGLLVVERLARVLVLDELDAVEVPGTADVADDRQVEQLLQGRPEVRGVVLDVVVEALALEDVEVRHGHGRAHGVAAEGVAVKEVVGALLEQLEQAVAGDHRADGGVAGG